MIVERTADLQILYDDKETYYRISYNDEFQYVLNNDLVNKSYLEKIVQELEEMNE